MLKNTTETIAFYKEALIQFNESGIPYLVGGAHALNRYTGIWRDTKDLDLFVMPEDCERVLKSFDQLGYKTELHFTHWIGKIFGEERVIDIIFSSANGLCPVDQDWFRYAPEDETLGVPVRLCPPEELIWQKAFIMERLRFDGADIAHIIQHCGKTLGWDRLIERFGSNWRVLLSHLILFGFIFPGNREKIPEWVMLQLTEKLVREVVEGVQKSDVCQGTYLSILEYLDDLGKGPYQDARLKPLGYLTADEIGRLTKAFTG